MALASTPWRKRRQAVVAADQTAGCVIQITVIGVRVRYCGVKEDGAMANIPIYAGWWDTSLTDRRNERALLSAFVAAIAVWTAAFLLAVI